MRVFSERREVSALSFLSGISRSRCAFMGSGRGAMPGVSVASYFSTTRAGLSAGTFNAPAENPTRVTRTLCYCGTQRIAKP